MNLHPSARLFQSGSSLGGYCCNTTREGLLNKVLRNPNYLRSILVLGPKDLDLRTPILSFVHHIVYVLVGAPSMGLRWRSLISALPTKVVGLAILSMIGERGSPRPSLHIGCDPRASHENPEDGDDESLAHDLYWFRPPSPRDG